MAAFDFRDFTKRLKIAFCPDMFIKHAYRYAVHKEHQNIRKKYIFYCYNLICKVVLVKKIKISTYQDNNCTRTPWLFTQLFTKIMEQLICMLLTLVRFLFLRLPVAPGAEKDGWQSSSCGGSAARKQDISCSQQPAQGSRSPHLSQDHRQRHLLSSKAPGSSRHAVRSDDFTSLTFKLYFGWSGPDSVCVGDDGWVAFIMPGENENLMISIISIIENILNKEK